MRQVAVMGGGAWATACAQVLADAGNEVYLWVRDEKVVKDINENRHNSKFHPNVKLSSRIKASSNPEEVLKNKELVFFALPAQSLRQNLESWKTFVSPTAVFVSLIKGIENSTKMRITEVMMDVFGCSENRVAALSGPNLAGEIIHRQPTASTVACADEDVAADIANALATNYFRVFWTTDVIGTELAGAIKNVVAIANGIAVGLGLGENTQSALITRGLAEMTRLGVALGAKTETFLGLAGIGDLIATSQSPLSRNRTFGEALGHGATIEQAQEKAHGTVEGSKSLAPLLAIAAKFNLDMPIAAQVLRVIRDGDDAHEVMTALLEQPITAEHE